jgi:hypothetical protein
MKDAKKKILSNPISTGLWWFVWLWIMLQSGFIITAYRKEKDNQDPQYTRQISKGLYLFAVVSMTTGWVAFILRLLRHVPMSKAVKEELEDVANGGESQEDQPVDTGEIPTRKRADAISGGRPGKLRQLLWKTKSVKSDIQAMDASRENVVKTSEWMSNVYLLILWNFVLGCWAVNDTRKSPNPGPNKTVLGLGAAAIVVGVLALLVGIFGAWLKKKKEGMDFASTMVGLRWIKPKGKGGKFTLASEFTPSFLGPFSEKDSFKL